MTTPSPLPGRRLTRRQRYFDVLLIVLGVVGSVVGLWDAFDRMSKAHDPLLALDEFSSHKNASIHHHTAPPHLSLATSTPVLANISEAVKKYGPREGVSVAPGKGVTAALNTTLGLAGVATLNQKDAQRAKVPSVSSFRSSLPGKGQPQGNLSAISSAALHGSVPSNGTVQEGDSPSKMVPKGEAPQSAALTGTVPVNVSSSNTAPKSVARSGTVPGVAPSASEKVQKVAAASPRAPGPTRAPPT